MADTFENRIRAAAIAGWWIFLINACFTTLHWIIYLVMMSNRPDWFLAIWGPGMDWESVQKVWLTFILALKMASLFLVLVTLWLMLWARQMRRQLR